MTTDTAVLENALTVMAICMAIQTAMFVGIGIGAFVAWKRTTAGMAEARTAAEAQLLELRRRLDHVTATVDEVAGAVIRGTAAVDEVMTDVRDAMGTVRHSVGAVASAVASPRAALAIGLLKGVQTWRKSRAGQRIEATATSDL
jgi:hypothetical protein